jgi:hypothetical protein
LQPPRRGVPDRIGGEARSVLSAPTGVVDPQTRWRLAPCTDFAASQALVAVRPPAIP